MHPSTFYFIPYYQGLRSRIILQPKYGMCKAYYSTISFSHPWGHGSRRDNVPQSLLIYCLTLILEGPQCKLMGLLSDFGSPVGEGPFALNDEVKHIAK